ncbi:MAG: hypothetical protein ACR2LS_07685, partial [Thermomicrobiales bacterium]
PVGAGDRVMGAAVTAFQLLEGEMRRDRQLLGHTLVYTRNRYNWRPAAIRRTRPYRPILAGLSAKLGRTRWKN